MANIQTPFGFRYKRSMNPSTVPLVIERPVTAGQIVYPGDLISMGVSPFVNVAASGTQVPYGVAIGYGDGNSTLRYEQYVLLIPLVENYNYVFEARIGSTTNIGINDIGKWLPATTAAGNAQLRQSRHGLNGGALDSTGGGISTGAWWQIVGITDDPQNEPDIGYNRVLVTMVPPLSGLLTASVAAT